MNLLDDARAALAQTEFRVTTISETSDTIHFEDESVLGFVKVFDTPDRLLSSWERDQDSFLRRYASALRAEPAKAWNIYSVLLCEATSPPELLLRFEAIEEDFRGSRKIARAGVATGPSLDRALLPLLPIRSIAVLEVGDPVERLRSRLRNVAPNVVEGLLGTTPVELIATWLAEHP
jgi:hypothetical protein